MSNNAKNLPEVKLGQYKGLAVTRHVRPLSEKTIDQEMVHQTRMRSVYHNSTAPAKRGSRVLLDFVGFMDGEEIPDSRMEKVMVVLGDGKLMPAAEDAIYGHTAGETFRFDFTYPEQFRVEELSGKTAQFEIKLHSVAEKTTPELNEEFARAQGYADLAAMREAVRAKKRKIHEDAADRAAGQELLAKAGANLTVDLPEAMLDRTADNEMRMLEQRLSRSNITLEKHCKNSHTTAAALRAGYRDAAERNLRSMGPAHPSVPVHWPQSWGSAARSWWGTWPFCGPAGPKSRPPRAGISSTRPPAATPASWPVCTGLPMRCAPSFTRWWIREAWWSMWRWKTRFTANCGAT